MPRNEQNGSGEYCEKPLNTDSVFVELLRRCVRRILRNILRSNIATVLAHSLRYLRNLGLGWGLGILRVRPVRIRRRWLLRYLPVGVGIHRGHRRRPLVERTMPTMIHHLDLENYRADLLRIAGYIGPPLRAWLVSLDQVLPLLRPPG